jgi:hypothetical protein
MNTSQLKPLKDLENENRKLDLPIKRVHLGSNQLYAEVSLENAAFQDAPLLTEVAFSHLLCAKEL